MSSRYRFGAFELDTSTGELDPEYPKTHFLLGYVHLAEGKVEDAVASFEKAIALSPETPKYRDAYSAALARLTR